MGITLKLLVNKESKKVVYAEAGKEFVDFLLGLMDLPLGSILRILSSLSLGKIYESAKSIEGSISRNMKSVNLSLTLNIPPILSSRSSSSNINYSYSSSQQTDEVDGYVKGAVAYMVMDDLTITPSSISSINLFKTHGIKDMCTLQEMIVQVHAEKALNLVRAAFGSSTVLTDIFIGKAPSVKPTNSSKT
ncbi:uncharacterized protein LOC110688605 [Chenopodium quinoa]|uniref:uncharacterized protein LOC110688605 n=1 Tax=Chenopodium quinoa TaxID=63459 RepID=UPI000B78E413|nr:uncharacterized protein LOC110688605 [Chenopodium quinoa]